MAVSPPQGFVKDPESPDWWFDPKGDPAAKTTWWQMPPEGFVPDPENPGWYFNPGKDIVKDPTAWWHDNTVIDDPGTKALSFWTFEEVAIAAGVPLRNAQDNWPHICRAAALWGIADPFVLIGFLGTMMKETGSLYPVREAWWVWNVDKQAAIKYYLFGEHAKYQGGTGWEYHGRGYVQLTHIGNYQMIQDRMAEKGVKVDLVGNPDLMLTPEVAAHGICIFFINNNLVARCKNREWERVRTTVYGGDDPDGVARLQQAEKALLPLAHAKGLA
jgi:hypothetical protein